MYTCTHYTALTVALTAKLFTLSCITYRQRFEGLVAYDSTNKILVEHASSVRFIN